MSPGAPSPALSASTFEAVRSLIYSVAGISMSREKEDLVRSRLMTRLRELKIGGYEEYLERVRTDRRELSNMVDVLTTNKTSFFREEHHFDFLLSNVVPTWQGAGRAIRIWSAGCSTGEEPYSVAMFLGHHLPALDVRILATDLSLRALHKARAGVYPTEAVDSIPPELRQKYVTRARGSGQSSWEIAPKARAKVSFARLNLMGAWPMRGPFDLILCRNVMIYFDDATRTKLVCRFADLLTADAHLFIGHSESLGALAQPLRGVEPAIYAP